MALKALTVQVVQTVTIALISSAVAYGQGNGKKNNVPPAVNITAPAPGARFTAPANITISANATDSDGSVKRVEFLANSTVLGATTQAPYSFIWNNVGAGTYSLQARATDNVNVKATSAAVVVTVTASQAPDPKSVSGSWSSLINFPNPAGCSGCAFSPIHMSLLANGNVLMWQDDNASGPRGSNTQTVAYVWDVGANTFTSVNNLTTDIFCSGHAFLPDGTLLAAG